MQKRAARVICNAHGQATRVKNRVPAYTDDYLKLNSDQHVRTTKYGNNNFICPRYNRQTEGGKTFVVTPCKLWNSLKLDLRNSLSLLETIAGTVLLKNRKNSIILLFNLFLINSYLIYIIYSKSNQFIYTKCIYVYILHVFYD